MTSFEIVYGQDPPIVHAHENGTTKVDSVDQYLKDKDRVMAILRSNLENAECNLISTCLKEN